MPYLELVIAIVFLSVGVVITYGRPYIVPSFQFTFDDPRAKHDVLAVVELHYRSIEAITTTRQPVQCGAVYLHTTVVNGSIVIEMREPTSSFYAHQCMDEIHKASERDWIG